MDILLLHDSHHQVFCPSTRPRDLCSSTSTTMTNIHVRRPLQINLHALLQQQTPTIDLGVESYENSTRNFLEAVAKYKNRSMTAIAERRRHEAHEKKKIMDKISTVEAETGQCKLKEIELVSRTLSHLFSDDPTLLTILQS